METFGNSLLEEVSFNPDGSLKQSGKQQAKFYSRTVLDFKAKPLLDASGNVQYDDNGKIKYDIDPKTGIPKKEAFEKTVDMVRVETKGDTNIKDDIADEVAKRQFYRQYKLYKSGKVPDGHPLEDFGFLQPGTVMELHLLGVHVLEQLAEMGDLECSQVTCQAGFEIRDIAQQWIKLNNPQVRNSRLASAEKELKKATDEIKELKSKLGGKFQVDPPVGDPAPEPDAEPESSPVVTLEVTPEQLQKRIGRPRKV